MGTETTNSRFREAKSGSFVVGLAPKDRAGAIQLFDKDQAGHLVGKRHAGKRKLTAGTGQDRLAEPEGAPQDEGHAGV